MSLKKPIGDPTILQKKLVANPKYETVASGVDTGINVNMTKALRDNEVSVKQGRDELFKRMRPSSLANYLGKKLARAMREQQMESMTPEEREQFQIAMGDAVVAEHEAQFAIPRAPEKDVLLIDLREREDFEKCHIGSAMHFPSARLSRAMNQFTPEVLQYKNKENAVVVLYDLEEELTVQRKCANVFVERGFDNIVVLSGGLREFVQEHSNLIVGESPVPIIPKPQAVLQGRRQLAARSANSVSGSTLGTSVATSHKPKSLSSSLARPRSNASQAGGAWR